MFLKVTVIGMIFENSGSVTSISAGEELIQLASIRRLVPLLKRDRRSSCVLTLVSDYEIPRARFVLAESYEEITRRLGTLTL